MTLALAFSGTWLNVRGQRTSAAYICAKGRIVYLQFSWKEAAIFYGSPGFLMELRFVDTRVLAFPSRPSPLLAPVFAG